MVQTIWRMALLALGLAGALVVLSLFAGLAQLPAVRAAPLKTTEEPLDPACNALGSLQVNVSPAEREEFSDENGGLVKACRYTVELVNTDERYAVRAFMNGSGSVERGEPVFHTRHAHKALDPGESYSRDMYVIIYPDGSEESYFYTYLKATYNDLDFPKDCRPMIDHLYTWDLPYRLVDTPCLDLSSDPPEIVAWNPLEGAGPAGEDTTPEEAGGEAGEVSSLQTGGEAEETQMEVGQAQQGGDPISQLVELLMLGDLGSLDQWEGWANLNDTQRANLLAIIERLDERASEYIPASQLALLNEAERQEALAQQQQDQLAQQLAERYQAWERLDILINRERLQDKSPALVWIYDNYRASQLVTGAFNQVRGWFDRLANPEDLAKDQAIEYLQAHTGVPVEEAAVEILKETASLANSPARAHYAYYLSYYYTYREQNMPHEQAHQQAMQDLRAAAENPPASGGGILNDEIWLSQNFIDMAAQGGIYDRVFGDLKGNYDPGVTP